MKNNNSSFSSQHMTDNWDFAVLSQMDCFDVFGNGYWYWATCGSLLVVNGLSMVTVSKNVHFPRKRIDERPTWALVVVVQKFPLLVCPVTTLEIVFVYPHQSTHFLIRFHGLWPWSWNSIFAVSNIFERSVSSHTTNIPQIARHTFILLREVKNISEKTKRMHRMLTRSLIIQVYSKNFWPSPPPPPAGRMCLLREAFTFSPLPFKINRNKCWT